ncbi:MAG: hypothetical protein HY667_02970, partial [Chloroflexi bacterium]|nr:hypothetical protein [Chloroflexota bacterium]
LPPIVGLIYLGGWTAFSPETLLTSLLPWYLYGLAVAWQTAHIMVYYPLHVIPPAAGEPDIKRQPAFFFVPSPQTAVNIGLGFTIVTLLLSVLLYFIARLSPLYLVLVVAGGIYATINALRLQKDARNRVRGLKAFGSLSIFRLVISGSILLAVFLAQI